MMYELVVDVNGEEQIVRYGIDRASAVQRWARISREVGHGEVFSVSVWEENRDGISHRIRHCEDC